MILLDDCEPGERAHPILGNACEHAVADAKAPHLFATRDHLARQFVAEHGWQPIALNKPQVAPWGSAGATAWGRHGHRLHATAARIGTVWVRRCIRPDRRRHP